MLLDHDSIDSLGVTESQETEATRTASSAVTHNGAFLNFAELREVVTKGF